MFKKTLLKTTSYAIMHFTIAVFIAYVLTGSWQLALAIGLLEPFAQTIAFFFHEQAWHRFEHKREHKDHHDSVIDSASPVTGLIDRYLHRKRKAS